MSVIENLCDSGLTSLVEFCKNRQIILQNKMICNDINEADTLYKNAKFYYSTNEYQGALVSYSCTAVLLNSVMRQLSQTDNSNAIEGGAEKRKVVSEVLNCCLRAVEVLFEKTKKMKKGGDDDEDDKEWDKICIKIKPLVFNKGSSNCLFFSDVAGLYEEKKTFESSLIYPLMYPNLYPKRSKGILLYGPPGTGKTYIVKAAVNELQQKGGKSVGVLFFAPSPGDLKGKYVGETEKRIEEIFTCASRAACNHELDCKNGKKYISIIFMDEADAIAPDRDDDPTGLAANSVNTLLQMMDGINSKPNVAVIAATNYPWKLDNAILRRFDTQILVDIPNEGDILELLNLEVRQMIQFKESKSEYSYCEQERKKESSNSNKNNEQSSLKCNIECENIQPPELYMNPPYNKVVIDYYDASNNDFKQGLVKTMKKDSFSNSDISRFFKTSATNAGELAVKANLFYSARLIKYNISEKFISCITKMKDIDEAIKLSLEIITAFKNNNLSTKMDIYQLKKPDIVSIEYDNYNYYNVKCLLYKSNELLIDHPSIKDVYVKGDKVTGVLDLQTYKDNILGGTSKEISIIISFNFTFKETDIDTNETPIFPASTNLISNIFKPIYDEIGTIKTYAKNLDIFKAGTGNTWLTNEYKLEAPGIASLNENTLFDISNRDAFIKPYVKKIIQSDKCDISARIDGLVSKDFDFKFCNFDFLRFLLLNKVKMPTRNTSSASGTGDLVEPPDAVLGKLLDTYVSSIYSRGNFMFANLALNDQDLATMIGTYSNIVFTNPSKKEEGNENSGMVSTLFNGTYFYIKIDDYIDTINYIQNYKVADTAKFYQDDYPKGASTNTYIKIEKKLFKILMRSSLGDNDLLTTLQKVTKTDEIYPEFDIKNTENIYFLKPEQMVTQIFLNDCYNFINLAKKIYTGTKLAEPEKLFGSYIKNLVMLSPDTEAEAAETLKIEQANSAAAARGPAINAAARNANTRAPPAPPPPNVKIVSMLLSLYQLCCVRIFDNYNFVINGVVTDPANPTAGGGQEKKEQEEQEEQPSGGKKKFKLNKKHKQKYESKITKRYPHNKNTTKTKKNLYGRGIEENQDKTINMIGGAVTYAGLIKFCANNNPSESTTSKIVDKSIFIATTYKINEVKRLRKDGLLNDVWYGGKTLLKTVQTYLTVDSGTNEEIAKEQIISEMKDKNQFLAFIFKEFKSIGFLAEQETATATTTATATAPANPPKTIDKVIGDKDVKVVKIVWSSTNDINNRLKVFLQAALGVVKASAGVSEVKPFGSKGANTAVNVLAVTALGILAFGGSVTLGVTGSVVLGTGYLGAVVAANMYNFIYAEDVSKEDVLRQNSSTYNSITLSIILNIITDVRYIETKDFNKSANQIFSEAITTTINKLGTMALGTYMAGTTTPDGVVKNVIQYKENYPVKQEMLEKITNLNIPIKSFSYAMTKVKTTYVKKTGEDLRLYKKNKDEFLEKRKKEKK